MSPLTAPAQWMRHSTGDPARPARACFRGEGRRPGGRRRASPSSCGLPSPSPAAPLPTSLPRLSGLVPYAPLPPRPGIPPPAPSNCSFEAPADVAAPRALPPCARGCRPAARFQLLFILSFSTLLKPARCPGLQRCSAGLLAGGAGPAGAGTGRGRGRGWGGGA